ncbi:hypothetical protein [Posidoniimonas polymericola]|nr:hypothetical protein [Posidoniimonas polymericola]
MLIAGLMVVQTGQAGVLSGNGAALPGWTGTVPYDNGNNLSGSIDFAVFTAADFNANFGGMGYVPGDAYVYTYQTNNAGSDNFSQLTVGITNPANTIGTFNIGDVDTSSSLFDGSGNAEFQFLSPAVATGQSSYGLAFSAPTLPIQLGGIISDGGGAIQIALPSPGTVPEPAAACLLALAGGVAVSTRRSRVAKQS